jgi:hypothetical protein
MTQSTNALATAALVAGCLGCAEGRTITTADRPALPPVTSSTQLLDRPGQKFRPDVDTLALFQFLGKLPPKERSRIVQLLTDTTMMSLAAVGTSESAREFRAVFRKARKP